MFADNSIVILQTADGFRVIHDEGGEDSVISNYNAGKIPELEVDDLYEIFRYAPCFKHEDNAYELADRLDLEIGYIEHGLIFLRFPETPFPLPDLSTCQDDGPDRFEHPYSSEDGDEGCNYGYLDDFDDEEPDDYFGYGCERRDV